MALSDNTTTGDTEVPERIVWEGGDDNDVKYGGAGDDELAGGAGDDFLDGGAGDDQLNGWLGNDTFSCNDGLDYIDDLGIGTDVLNVNCWGAVEAYLSGDWFSDIWSNNDGKATLFANNHNVDVSLAEGTQGWKITNELGQGSVVLVGSILNDTLVGGSGDDVITGNAGDDILPGGAGADKFVFNAQTGGNDTITDFHVGEDSLVFSGGNWGPFTFTDGTDGTLVKMQDGSSIMLLGAHFPKQDELLPVPIHLVLSNDFGL
jgi:Ca2+-binding RTX toxin-like protein